ncbi:MAG: phenylalanine--tRNA ligase subunit alpha [Candidatus Altiarchaeota archaeon]
MENLHPHEIKILSVLKGRLTPKEISERAEIPVDAVMRALSWLFSKDLVQLEEKIQKEISIADEGKIYLKKGLPERQIIEFVKNNKKISEVEKKFGKEITSIGISWLKRKNLAKIENGIIKIISSEKTSDEKLLELLEKKKILKFEELNDELKQAVEFLKKRQDIIKISERRILYAIPTKKGLELSEKEFSFGISQLTPELLKTGRWKGEKFREYDVNIFVFPEYPAKKHPLTLMIEKIREIFITLGFNEISGSLVESAFWNFDALFQPQDHPAREMQDTFYLKTPKEIKIDFWDKLKNAVRDAHEKSWKYSWNEEIAKKTLLRTHTTSVTAHYLSTLRREDLPKKVFCIGKTFRNEALDYKHLPEFYQVDGIIVDENANFRNLLGILKRFYDELGFKVRFRPGYFPYTEPSLECEIYLENKKEWIELGGAGIFRPEMVNALLGFDCPVLAWGLGLERLIMLSLNMEDIRDIYISDIKWLRERTLKFY